MVGFVILYVLINCLFLQYIASNFNKDTDPALLDKTAGFFLQHEQYDKAVDLYVASVQAIKALELCLQYNINIR